MDPDSSSEDDSSSVVHQAEREFLYEEEQIFEESKEETRINEREKIAKRVYPFNYNPQFAPNFTDDIWTVLRGFRNGFIYGMKIRLPHAFVMTLLFNRKEFGLTLHFIFIHCLFCSFFFRFCKAISLRKRCKSVKKTKNMVVVCLIA